MQDHILAVLAAYQERALVGDVVCQVREQGLPTLVVDDGSTDDTGRRAEAAGAVVLRHDRNRGKGMALQTGFRWALKNGYEAVLTLDADGQHDPAEIPLFLNAYRESGYDLLIGFRNFNEMPWTRQMTNSIGRWTLTRLLGEPMLDNQSGYRLLSRRLVKSTFESIETGYEFEVDVIAICLRRGCSLGWVPIRTIYNGQPSHINHFRHVYNYLRLLWRIRRQNHDRSKNGEPGQIPEVRTSVSKDKP